MSFAILQFANLSGANLTGARVLFANLFYANLRKANLSGANLSGAKMPVADLFYANLCRVNMSRAYLNRANLRSANLSGANFSGVDLSNASLRSADLSGTDFSGANLSNANLRGANLSGAILSCTDLSGAIMPDGTIHDQSRGLLSRSKNTQVELDRKNIAPGIEGGEVELKRLPGLMHVRGPKKDRAVQPIQEEMAIHPVLRWRMKARRRAVGVPKYVQDQKMNLLTDLLPGWAGKGGIMCDWMGVLETEHQEFPYRIK